MQDERHDAGGEDIVAHPGVPRNPHALENVEVNIVAGDFLEGVPISVGGMRQRGRQDRRAVERSYKVHGCNGRVRLLLLDKKSN